MQNTTYFHRRTLAVSSLVILLLAVMSAVTHQDAASAARRNVRKVRVIRRPANPPKTVIVVPTPPSIGSNFSVRFLQDQQSVTAGETAVYSFDVSTSGAFTGAVVFDLPNLTDRFTGRIIAESGTQGRLEITVPPFAATNSGVFVLRGRSGTISQQAAFRLNVTALPVVTTTTTTPPPSASAPSTTIAPTFTITPSDTRRVGGPGDQLQYGISINRSNGFTGNVDLRVDGLPKGATANFSPNPTNAGSVLYVTPSATTPSGTYLLSIVAQAGSTTHAAAVQLVVRQIGDFALSLLPTSISVPAGNDAVAALNVVSRSTASPPVAPDVAFTATGLPDGAAAIFDPNPSNGLTTLRVRTAAATPVGTYKVNVTGTSGTIVHSVVLTVIVQSATVGGFGLAAAPASAAANPNGDTVYTYNLTITPTGGFNSTITFVVRNLPPFATFAVSGQTATAAVIKITTKATTPSGSFPLQITGTAGNLSATVQVDLVVT